VGDVCAGELELAAFAGPRLRLALIADLTGEQHGPISNAAARTLAFGTVLALASLIGRS